MRDEAIELLSGLKDPRGNNYLKSIRRGKTVGMGDELHVMVNYYARIGYGHHIQSYCAHLLRRPRDPLLLFWHAYGLLLEGSCLEALRAMEPLKEHREIEVAVLAAMLHMHQHSSVADADEIQNLKNRLQIAEQNASERALVLAATLYWHLGSSENLRRSRDLVTRVLRVQPHYAQAQCLHGWLALPASHTQPGNKNDFPVDWKTAEASFRIFEEVLIKGSNIEALLGRAHFYKLKQEYVEALGELSQVIVLHAWFLPALVEKAHIAMLLQEWDLLHETSQLIVQKDSKNIEGLRLSIHSTLCSENKPSTAASLLTELLKSIEQREPLNAYLCHEVVRSCARLAGRGSVQVLHRTMAIIERARRLKPRQPAFAIELADQHFLLGDYKSALATYRLTSHMDELNMDAMYGSIQCLLVNGDLDEAEQQLEFIAEVSVSTGKSASLSYLMAQLYWRKHGDHSRCRDLLDESLQIQTNNWQNFRHQYDFTFYAELNPDMRLGIAHLYITLSQYECKGPHVERSYSLKQAVDVLEHLITLVSGLVAAHLMLALALIQFEDYEDAHRSLQSVISLDIGSSSAHLLFAQIYVKQGKYELARQSLEQALSADFVVRETVAYHVLQARILVKSLQFEEALKVLEVARSLPDMQRVNASSRPSYYTSKKPMETTDTDRVMVFLLLAEVHIHFNHFPEATKTIQDAMNEFAGSPEEVRVVISNCELALGRGDTAAAIAMLSQVPQSSDYYVQARIALADVYLKHEHNKSLYTSCYMELAQLFPNAKTYMMLGEALMRVDESEEAVKAYAAASKESPRDAMVANQAGQALVITHEYSKAVEHYEHSLLNVDEGPTKLEMRYDFGELNFKLKNYQRTSEVLCELLANVEDRCLQQSFKNAKMLMLCLKASLLLSKVQNIQGQLASSTQAMPEVVNNRSKYLHHYKVMFKARDLFNNYLLELQGQHSDAIQEQKHVAADIYFQFAQECEVHNDADKAISLLNEALKCNPAHGAASVAIAKIHLARGEVGECEQRCAALLRADPFNDEASDILVYLMIHRELYESAILHFQQLLDRNPNHYSALSQLIRLFRRAGRIDEVGSYLSRAEKATPAAPCHAGLSFCKGLLARYCNKPYDAIMMMNNARADVDWGKPAIFAMVMIYLNIDNELGWEEANLEGPTVTSEEAIKIAHKLLKESRNLEGKSVKQAVLECYASMATRHKSDIENAMVRLQELVGQDTMVREKERVSSMLAVATGLTMLRQAAKAKNQLRAIDRMPYKWDDGDEFERAWLMLANIHMQAGKQEAAEELCKKCLKYNKQCSKAWELLGLMMEKSNSFAEAVTYYENAWKCQKEASPSVGYRLAFTYLKDKRHIEAITVCHKVLQISPNYPKIRKDILEKARVCVRA